MVEEVDALYRKLPPSQLPPAHAPLTTTPPVDDLAKRCHSLLKSSKITSQALFDYVQKIVSDASLSLTRRLELFLVVDRVFHTEHHGASTLAHSDPVVDLAAKLQSKALFLVACVCPRTPGVGNGSGAGSGHSDYEAHRERAMCIVTMREMVRRWLSLSRVFASTRMLQNVKNLLKSMQLPDLESLLDDRASAASESDGDDAVSSFPKRSLTSAEQRHRNYTEKARHSQKHERVKGYLRRDGEPPDAEFHEHFDAVFHREQPWERSEQEFKLFWDWRPQTVELAKEARERQRLADPPQSTSSSQPTSSPAGHSRSPGGTASDSQTTPTTPLPFFSSSPHRGRRHSSSPSSSPPGHTDRYLVHHSAHTHSPVVHRAAAASSAGFRRDSLPRSSPLGDALGGSGSDDAMSDGSRSRTRSRSPIVPRRRSPPASSSESFSRRSVSFSVERDPKKRRSSEVHDTRSPKRVRASVDRGSWTDSRRDAYRSSSGSGRVASHSQSPAHSAHSSSPHQPHPSYSHMPYSSTSSPQTSAQYRSNNPQYYYSTSHEHLSSSQHLPLTSMHRPRSTENSPAPSSAGDFLPPSAVSTPRRLSRSTASRSRERHTTPQHRGGYERYASPPAQGHAAAFSGGGGGGGSGAPRGGGSARSGSSSRGRSPHGTPAGVRYPSPATTGGAGGSAPRYPPAPHAPSGTPHGDHSSLSPRSGNTRVLPASRDAQVNTEFLAPVYTPRSRSSSLNHPNVPPLSPGGGRLPSPYRHVAPADSLPHTPRSRTLSREAAAHRHAADRPSTERETGEGTAYHTPTRSSTRHFAFPTDHGVAPVDEASSKKPRTPNSRGSNSSPGNVLGGEGALLSTTTDVATAPKSMPTLPKTASSSRRASASSRRASVSSRASATDTPASGDSTPFDEWWAELEKHAILSEPSTSVVIWSLDRVLTFTSALGDDAFIKQRGWGEEEARALRDRFEVEMRHIAKMLHAKAMGRIGRVNARIPMPGEDAKVAKLFKRNRRTYEQRDREKEFGKQRPRTWTRCCDDLDALTDGWLRAARRALRHLFRRKNVVNFVVTTTPLTRALAELILYDLSAVVPMDSVFSVRAGCAQTCQVFEQLCMRYGFRVRYLAIVGEESDAAREWEGIHQFPKLLEVKRVKSIRDLERLADECGQQQQREQQQQKAKQQQHEEEQSPQA